MADMKICKCCGQEFPNTTDYFPKVSNNQRTYLRKECIQCNARNKNARAKARKAGKSVHGQSAYPTRKTFTIDRAAGLVRIEQVIAIKELKAAQNQQNWQRLVHLWAKQGYEIVEVKP